jgi:hypothetical protein
MNLVELRMAIARSEPLPIFNGGGAEFALEAFYERVGVNETNLVHDFGKLHARVAKQAFGFP